MTLDDLDDDVTAVADELGEELTVSLDRETRNELATLAAVFDGDSEELLRRGVHALFRQTVETGDLDFHLRRGYDLTYDEYLAGVTYDEMAGQGGTQPRQRDDSRRYQQ